MIPKVNAKNKRPPITTTSLSSITPDACALNGADVLLPVATSMLTSITVPPVHNKSTFPGPKKRQDIKEIKATAIGAVSNQIKIGLPRRFNHFGKSDSHWLVIINLPNTVSKLVIKNFLSGLKIIEMYGYYHIDNVDKTERKQPTDVYVQFESQAGLEAAMLRNGELIKVERKSVIDTTTLNDSSTKELPLMDSFVTSLNRVSVLEATWAKALCVRLESHSNNCLQNISRLRSLFPLSLLSISPSKAAEKWLPFAPLGSYLLPNEIFSFSDYQKKNNATSVSRYDYSESRGLYRDIHQMGGDISYAGLSGFGGSPSLGRPLSNNLSSADHFQGDKETDFRNCYVEDHLLKDSKINLRNHYIYGMQEFCNPLQEISHNLNELSSILSDTLIMSYSTDISTINDSTNYSENELVLDLAHRMSHMYQNIHKTIKNKRYSYSKPI